MADPLLKPTPPPGLRPETRQWFLATCERWVLEPHHVRLLALCCQAWDEAQTAAALVRAEGVVIVMPSGAKRPHPAARLGNDARAMFTRCLRELDLDLEPPQEVRRRPPNLRSIAGQSRG
jgi:phage terminase small subunit